MEKVFLAYSFGPKDRDLVADIEKLLASYGVLVVTGERVGGGQITTVVHSRIDESDGLIALLTRDVKKDNGAWATHDWVKDELQYGRTKQKRTVALVEDGVEISGAYGEHERICFKRKELLNVFLSLAETIGQWNYEIGRLQKVQILPDVLASSLGSGTSNTKCRYRFFCKGKSTEWKEVQPQPETGGTFVYLPGVRDDYMIQLEVSEQNRAWRSLATSQWMQVTLNPIGGK